MSEPLNIGIQEAARKVGVCADTLRRGIKSGSVSSVRIGRRLLIPVSEIQRIVNGETTVNTIATKTKDMSLREYLSSMSFQPKQAAALEALFKLPDKIREDIGDSDPSCSELFESFAVELEQILDS